MSQDTVMGDPRLAPQVEAVRQEPTEWFVYSNAQFYPDATIVHAFDADDAIKQFGLEGYSIPPEGLAVFPLSALAKWVHPQRHDIRDVLDCFPEES